MHELVRSLQSGALCVTAPLGQQQPEPVTVRLRGWVRSIRGSKVTSFLQVNDGTEVLSVQCVVDASVLQSAVGVGADALSNGCSVEVEGTLVYSYRVVQSLKKQVEEGADPASIDPLATLPTLLAAAAGTPMPQLPLLEVLASRVHVFGACDQQTYPMQKQSLPLDHLRDFLHLRTRTATISAVMRIRSRAQMGVHQFFQDEGFFNVHTPILTPLDCEGAGEVFTVTASSDTAEQPFFGRPTYLTVSGQLYGEMLACSLSRVYTFGPTFRAEQSQTARHLNEFWMVEPEIAHASLDDVIHTAERFVKFMLQYVMTHCDAGKHHTTRNPGGTTSSTGTGNSSPCPLSLFSSRDLRYLQGRLNPSLLSTLSDTVSQPFARITYAEAIRILQASKRKFEFQPTWEKGLQSEHEKYLAEVKFKR